MISKKTYIPGKPRNKKLTNVTSGAAGVGKTEFTQVAGDSHTHPNKGVLDQITEAMLASASRDMITSTDTETELTDENYLSSLRVLKEILDNNEYLRTQFLSKVNPDTAQEIIKFVKGIEIGTFTTGTLGAGAAIKMENGVSRMEVDQLDVRMRATFRELIIESLKHIGGQLILSPARMKCTSVVDGGTYYKCYFDTGDGKVSNEFVAGDQARCQVFTGSGVKMYWRLVTSVGTDWINLSKTDAISGSSIPEAGDDIVQLGNRSDATRQNAQILSTVGVDAPSWKQYKGINSFSLEGKDTTVFSGTGNKIDGKTVFVSSGSNLDDWAAGTSQDVQDAQAAANAAALAAQQAIDDAAANVTDYNAKFATVQAQIDGEVSNWFYPYSPTLANYPASDWTTNTIKDRHIGDTFTNTAQAPATDAGKSWRFVVNAGVYSWTQIADSDAVLALQKAAQAQSTADGKSTTYLIQPTSYKLGDMWVLAADQTVNGIAYKSGEILTATQDSTTFVQAHWVKKVRYTDDTAINNMQIGGRNYFSINDFVADNIARGYSTISVIEYEGNIAYRSTDIALNHDVPRYLQGKFEANTQYYFKFNILWESYTNPAASYTFLIRYTDGTTSGIHALTTQTHGAGLTAANKTIDHISTTRQYSGDVVIYNIQLEKGNKATDWTPAPEDVQAEINQAKQEALTAAGNAQTSANNANTAVGDLNTYVEGSFKDGVIEASEAKAIEKYINIVNTEKSNLEATYNTLYVNTYLEGAAKTNLLNAKVTYFGAVDTLLASISTAITDGKTTTAEKQAVDTNYSSYKTALASLQTAIENANKAIQTKLDAISKGYVDNLEVGGINLYPNSKIERTAANEYVAWDVTSIIQQYNGKKLTYSIDVIVPIAGNVHLYSLGSHGVGFDNVHYLEANVWTRIAGTGIAFYDPNPSQNYCNLSIYGIYYTGRIPITRNLKIEIGDKATDYSEAPEDVQARIDAEKTRINEILSDNIADPSEKQYLSNLWQEIYAEYPRIWAQANTYAVDKSNYEAKYSALNTLLSPVLADLTTNSTVSGASIRTAFSQYYDARTFLLNNITNKVNTTAADAQAKANTAKAVTDKFSGFDGGLATAVIMEMREPSTTTRGDATAGTSGIQGAQKNLPAFWAGGTYAQAVAGTAKSIDKHDGSGHRAGGKLAWDAAGNLTVEGTINATDGEFTGTVKGNAGYFEGLVRIPFVETYNQTAWWGDESGFHPIITNPATASTNVIARNQPGAGRTSVKLPTVAINGYRISVFNGETADNGSINFWGKIEISAGTKQILNANYGFTTDIVDQYNDQPGTISVLTGRSNPISANSMIIDFGEYVELVGVGNIGWIVTNRLKAR